MTEGGESMPMLWEDEAALAAPVATAEVVVQVDRTPPSLNTISGRGGHWQYTKARQLWYAVLIPALRGAGMVPCESVHVEGHVTFPDRRKRDQGNYRSSLEKFLGDALQEGGWLVDDDWDRFQFGDLQAGYEKGVRRTRLVLFCSGVHTMRSAA